MINRLTFFVLLFSAFGLRGQVVTDLPQEEPMRFNVKFYPFALVTGVKAEVGYRFNNNFELNVQAKHIYNGLFWYRQARSQFPSFYFVPSTGYRIMISYEKWKPLKNAQAVLCFGPKVGYESIRSSWFDSREELPNGAASSNFLQQNRERYVGAFIFRLRTKQKGLFLDVLWELGVSYTELNQLEELRLAHTVDSSEEFESYAFPHLLFGIAVGYGF